MSEESTNNPKADANGFSVRENADNIRVLQGAPDWNFPARWKSLCLKILQQYKELRREELDYSRLGWTKIRDEVMEPIDALETPRTAERDARLTRQDLEAWERGVDISDEKFRFIEVFIRKLQSSPRFESLFDDLRLETEKQRMRSLADLYISCERREQLLEAFRDNVPRITITNELEGLWLKHIIAQIQFEFEGVFKILFAYSPLRIGALNSQNCHELIFYEGYAIPLLFSKRQSARLELRSVVKLVRPEFRGNIGFGYADGELHFVASQQPQGGPVIAKKLTIDYPNHIISPALDVIEPDRKLTEDLLLKTFSEGYRHDHPLESFQGLGPDLAAGPIDSKKPEGSHMSSSGKNAQSFYRNHAVTLRQSPQNEKKLEEILLTSYKGYLFWNGLLES